MESFGFAPGQVLAEKYEVVNLLGSGWEGEVYRVRELATDIERAAKLFFPQRNPHNRVVTAYAKKLHKLRYCSALIQYLNQEQVVFGDSQITMLVSEYVEGELLSRYLARQRGKRLPEFEALHLIHALATAVAPMHRVREHHGDLHGDNIILRKHGLGFDIKLLDLYHWGHAHRQNALEDVCDIIRLLYDLLGGQRHYASQRQEIKDIIRGLRRTLIAKRFTNADQLRLYLENMVWRDSRGAMN